MSTGQMETSQQENRQHMAAEVVELGETLFELLLEYTTQRDGPQGDSHKIEEEAVKDELRAAKDEVFVALRLLLGLG